jgi:hypothetical protein
MLMYVSGTSVPMESGSSCKPLSTGSGMTAQVITVTRSERRSGLRPVSR